MSIDLGGTGLEVAIGLAFVFFLLSLIVSAGTEAISWIFKRRAKTLIKGVRRLLGNVEVANQLLEHPLVQTDVTTDLETRPPSYVSPRNFALALVQSLRAAGEEGDKAFKQLKAGVAAHADSKLGKQLQGLLEEGEGSLAGFRTAAERWFDDGMDRVSGWYKRWSQIIACVLALVVAIGINADAIRIAERLAGDPALRGIVVKQAEAEVAAGPPSATATAGDEEEDLPTKPVEQASKTFHQVQGLGLPILWSEGNDNVTVNTVFGWLITAIAISLGAPFWFDALSKLARLRTTGKKPDDSGAAKPA